MFIVIFGFADMEEFSYIYLISDREVLDLIN